MRKEKEGVQGTTEGSIECSECRRAGENMAINFNQNSVWNLRPIKPEDVREDVNGLLIDGEYIVSAFQTVRDQLVFTNLRIISIDVQGLTGKKRTFATMPYSKVQFFTIQTPGFMEFFADTELTMMFSNGFTAKFEFRGSVDIGAISRVISARALL